MSLNAKEISDRQTLAAKLFNERVLARRMRDAIGHCK